MTGNELKALGLLIDERDEHLLVDHNWAIDNGYARAKDTVSGVQDTAYLHNLILPPVQGVYVDHENRNRLDCRRLNLRYLTNTQNCFNRALNRNNTSGYKGVRFHKGAGRWMATISLGKKTIYLGLFNTPEEGARAYNKAVLEYVGPAAYQNSV